MHWARQTEDIVIPSLSFLMEWSLRWAALIAPLMLWFRFRPARNPWLRHSLLTSAFAAGLLLPVMPRWIVTSIDGIAPAPIQLPITGADPHSFVQEQTPTHATPTHTQTRRTHSSNETIPPNVSRSQLRLWLDRGPAWPSLRTLGLIAAFAWLSIVLVMSARLLGGAIMLTRWKARANLASSPDRELLDHCQRDLQLHRTVVINIHKSVTTPVVIGGLRPIVLVPADWDRWPFDDRRAALLHELAHLAHADDWAKWLEECVRIPFFFHPMVRWLFAALDKERELLCDQQVIALGVTPDRYARLLLRLAQGSRRLTPRSHTLVSQQCALPFFRSVTLDARMKQLLEDPTLMSPIARNGHRRARRRFALAFLTASQALLMGSFHIRAVELPPTVDRVQVSPNAPTAPPDAAPRIDLRSQQGAVGSPNAAAHASATPTSANASDWTCRGIVRDPAGKPIADAEIVVVTDHSLANRIVLRTGRDGTFSRQLPGRVNDIDIVAYRKGFAPSEPLRVERQSAIATAAELALRQPLPFSATLVDARGQALKGAIVRVDVMATELRRENGSSQSAETLANFHDLPSEIDRAYQTTTADDGRFTLAEMPAERNAFRITATTSTSGFQRPWRVLPQCLPEGRLATMAGLVSRDQGPTPVIMVKASKIEGKVVTAMPGVSVRNLKVWITGCRGQGCLFPLNSTKVTLTNPAGEFDFDGLSPGPIAVCVGEEEPNPRWTCRAQSAVLGIDEIATLSLELIPGVMLEGSVVEQTTHRPIPSAKLTVYSPARPIASSLRVLATTNEHGEFHLRVPSGKVTVVELPGFPGFQATAPNWDLERRAIVVPDQTSPFRLPAFELVRASTRPTNP